MAQFVMVGKTSELGPGKSKTVEVGGVPVAVFNVGGTYYAIEDTCSHVGGPLSEGELDGATVTCPWHGAQFDLATGKALTPPASTGLKTYHVHVEGDEVKIAAP